MEEKAFGRECDLKRVSQTVRIDMADTMRYSPARLEVILSGHPRTEGSPAIEVRLSYPGFCGHRIGRQ